MRTSDEGRKETRCSGTLHFIGTDEERRLFADRLDLVPDALVETYVRQAGWHRDADEKQTSEATYDFRRRALARFANIQDEGRRRSAQEWFREINHE